MIVMNFTSWVNHLKESSSVKENELNRILDKISNSESLTDSEKKFLNLFNSSSEDNYKDYMCLTKNDVFNKVRDLLEDNHRVICDLYDKDGQIGLQIISIHNNFDEDFCFVTLKNGEKATLKDNFSYSVIYDMKKDEYSLRAQDEVFEKIPVSNED